MEPENYNEQEDKIDHFVSLKTVTPLSKYLAMGLFILLPFIGGWFGYHYAPQNAPATEEQTITTEETLMPSEQPTISSQDKKQDSYLLTISGGTFEILDSEQEQGKSVLYESDSPMLFGLPWFVDGDESRLLKSEGVEVNNNFYVSIWVKTQNQQDNSAEAYEWYLGEYSPESNKFQLLLDSSYLQLDDSYSEKQALYLSPDSDYENKNGHIVLNVVLCERCGPGPLHYAVLNYKTRELTLLGRANFLEWADDSTYRYKTESELGASQLDDQTRIYVEEFYNDCADHPIACYNSIDWNRIPWIEKTLAIPNNTSPQDLPAGGFGVLSSGKEDVIYYVGGNNVVKKNLKSGVEEVLYTESNPDLTLIEDAGINSSWGNLTFGAFEEYLLVARYQKELSDENGMMFPSERFVDVVLINLRSNNR